MDKNNQLLPLAFDISKIDGGEMPLSTLPRARDERDKNAGGTFFHTRGSDTKRRIESVNSPQRQTRKARKYDTSDMLTSDDFQMDMDPIFPGTSTQKDLRSSFISSDFDHFPSSESAIHADRMPSSPVPHRINSTDDEAENDFNPLADKTFILPSSPQNVHDNHSQSPAFTVPKALSKHALKERSYSDRNAFVRKKSVEEFDFGIDKFNRVQGVHSDQPSSDLGIEDQNENKASLSSEEHARNIISQCFEEQRTEVHLENHELAHIPEEIEDLKNLVTFGHDGSIVKPKLQLYISHNNIRSVTPRLFELGDMIEVLSLRSNRLKAVPGVISKLTSLNYLNLASNSIETLPHQILLLDNLQKLLLRPNSSLLEMASFNTVTECSDQAATSMNNMKKRFVGRLKYVNRHEHTINQASIMMNRNLSILSQTSESNFAPQLPQKQSADLFDEEEQYLLKSILSNVPRLSELCLRQFSSYKTSKAETKKWSRSVGLNTSKLVAKALHQGAYGETCSTCGNTVIQHVAEVIEWWDIAEAKLVPVKKQFCCGRCIKVWREHSETNVI